MGAGPAILPPSNLTLRRTINSTGRASADVLRRLSTGRRATRGVDDPARLVAGQSLAAEGRRIDESVKNATRAASIADIVDSTLQGVNDNLKELRRLVGSSANLITREERAANQLEVDGLVADIDKLIRGANFNGKPLLRAVPPTPTPIPEIQDIALSSTDHAQTGQAGRPASYGLSGSTHTLTGNQWRGFDLGGYAVTPDTVLNLKFSAPGGGLGEIHGVGFYDDNSGTFPARTFAFAGTQNYGNTTFKNYAGGVREYEIRPGSFGITTFSHLVLINDDDGPSAPSAVGTFRDVRLYEDVPSVTGDPTVVLPFSLTPDGRGLETGRDTLTIPELSSTQLGTGLANLRALTTGGTHTLDAGNLQEAGDAVDAAINEINRRRGQVGGFRRYTVGSTQAGQREAQVQHADAASQLNDTDFAAATAELARLDVLRQSHPDLMAVQRTEATRLLDLLN